MAGGVVPSGNRVRIKGRKKSVARFFIISVAYTVVWIALSSQLGHYRAEYGPQILLQLSTAFYLPSIPILLLSPKVEKLLDMLVGNCRSMQYRMLFGLSGCAIISAFYPFMHHQLWLMLLAVMVLGACSAIAFSTSYQLVAWFRAADTIALGIGCVGSGPIVLILQVALGLKVQPAPWQWIAMFIACAAIVLVGMGCTMSLFWQYGDIISGKIPYIEKPLLTPEGEEEEEEDDDDEFDEHGNSLAVMLSRMVSVADPFQGMPIHFAGYVDEDYARRLRAHGLVRRVASADSDLGFLRITAPTSGLDYSALSRLPMKGPMAPDAYPPPAEHVAHLPTGKLEPVPAGSLESAVAVAGWNVRSSVASQLIAESESTAPRRVSSHQSLSGFEEPGGPLHESDALAALDVSGAMHSTLRSTTTKLDAQLPGLPPRLKTLSVPAHVPNSAPPTFGPGLSDTLKGHSPVWDREANALSSHEEHPSTPDTHEPKRVAFEDDVSNVVAPLEQDYSVSHADILDALEKAGDVCASHSSHPHQGSNAEEVEATPDALQLTWEAFTQLWVLVVWTLVSSTIINLIFPFFTYLPSSGLLGDYLPQVLFYVRIMADICGRFLPRLKGPFSLTSTSSVVTLALVMLGVASAFFAILQKHWGNDWIWLGIVVFLWFTGGFVNTNSFTLAPNMVDSRLTAQASAIMALTYQVAHFLGLVIAAVSAYVMFGDITGGGH